MVQKVPVGKDGLFALVDDEDFALVSQYKWRLVNGYAVHGYMFDGKSCALRMHRLILGLGPSDPRNVDHASHNRLDNSRANLRICSVAENRRNSRKTKHQTSSQYKGVYYNVQAQKWHTRMYIDGKRISLGHFDAEIDAARAYDSAAMHFFGIFACLNFPNSMPAPYLPRLLPSSICVGVSYQHTRTSRNKWRAQFVRKGRTFRVGYFLTEADAITALQTYKREHSL